MHTLLSTTQVVVLGFFDKFEGAAYTAFEAGASPFFVAVSLLAAQHSVALEAPPPPPAHCRRIALLTCPRPTCPLVYLPLQPPR